MKKIIALLLGAMLISGSFSGCKSKDSITTVTFQTWNPADTGPDSAIYKIIDTFEKENPNINIEYEFVGSEAYQDHLRVNLMKGGGPDVYGISAGDAFESFSDFEENLTPYCKQTWGDSWNDKFIDSCIDSVTKDGKALGLPLGQTYAGLLWADVNMLRKYDCQIPINYNQMQETCNCLREKGQYPLAIGARDYWVDLDLWMSMAADIDKDALYDAIEGKQSFESESIIESFKIWQDCFTNGVFQDKAMRMSLYDDVNNMFQREGLIPMFVNGSWAMNMYTISDEKTNAVFNSEDACHQVFLIDWNNDGKVAPVTSSVDVILCMNPESKVKDAAFRWMDYLVNDGQKLLVNEYHEYMPTLADMELDMAGLRNDEKRNLEFIIETGKNNVAGPRGIKYKDLNRAVCYALEDLAYGDITPEQAAHEIQLVSQDNIR